MFWTFFTFLILSDLMVSYDSYSYSYDSYGDQKSCTSLQISDNIPSIPKGIIHGCRMTKWASYSRQKCLWRQRKSKVIFYCSNLKGRYHLGVGSDKHIDSFIRSQIPILCCFITDTKKVKSPTKNLIFLLANVVQW